jgi:hypothetical protein
MRAALWLAMEAPVGAPACAVALLAEVREEVTAMVHRAQADCAAPPGAPDLVADLLLMAVYGEFYRAFHEDGPHGPTTGNPGAVWRLLFSALAGQCRVIVLG